MDTKAAFEKWATDNGFSIQFDTDNNEYSHASTRNAFSGFIGGREAIVIPSSSDSEYWFEGTFQRMRYERDVEKAITSHGIKVKS